MPAPRFPISLHLGQGQFNSFDNFWAVKSGALSAASILGVRAIDDHYPGDHALSTKVVTLKEWLFTARGVPLLRGKCGGRSRKIVETLEYQSEWTVYSRKVLDSGKEMALK